MDTGEQTVVNSVQTTVIYVLNLPVNVNGVRMVGGANIVKTHVTPTSVLYVTVIMAHVKLVTMVFGGSIASIDARLAAQKISVRNLLVNVKHALGCFGASLAICHA